MGVDLHTPTYLSSVGSKSSTIFWFVWFFVCLYPVNFGDVSVNYLIVFTPLLVLSSVRAKIKIPANNILFLFLFLFLLFLFGALVDGAENLLQSSVRFFIFMSVFSLVFINLSSSMIKGFVFAVAFFCLILLVEYLIGLLQGGNGGYAEYKRDFGSQRSAPVLLFAFAFFFSVSLDFQSRAYLILSMLLFLACLLTMSRAAQLTAVVILILILIFKSRKLKTSVVLTSFLCVLLSFLTFVFLFNDIFDYFYLRIVPLFSAAGRSELLSFQGSEFIRFSIWREIVSFCGHEWVSCIRFLGPSYVSSDVLFGSAHSDVFDRVSRIGFLGTFIYYFAVLLCFVRLAFSFSNFCFALGSLIIFGFFHESLASPHGVVLLSFCFAMAYQRNCNINVLRNVRV